MALFKIFRGTSQNLPTSVHDGYAYFTTDDGKFYIDVGQTRILINPDTSSAEKIQYIYEDGGISNVKEVLDNLLNTPQIQAMAFEIHTVREWSSRGRDERVSKQGCLYIYSDSIVDSEGVKIPRIKIGDGYSIIKNLPFLGVQLQNLLIQHINDFNIHVTELEKEIWSSKQDIENISIDEIRQMMSI